MNSPYSGCSVLLSLVLCAAVSPAVTVAQEQSLVDWESICRTDVCRATGHDGVKNARVSPDGDRLALHVHTKSQRGIYLQTRETGAAEFWVEGDSPVWLPGGEAIVYRHDNNLWVIAVGSDEPTPLTDDKHAVRDPRPSPDGTQVAYYSPRSGYQDIWLVDVNGTSKPRQLTDASMTLEEARFVHAWSPKGDAIAYFSNKDDYWSDDLWVVDTATGQERRLSSDFMGRAEPAWAPDGSRIAAYGSAKSDFWYGDLTDIFIVDLESGSESAVPMDVHAMDIGRVVWSGDGEQLYFPRHERGEIELWSVPLAGGVATRVSNMGGMIHAYDATPDADSFIFVRSTPIRGREVDHLDGSGGQVRQLSNFSTEWPDLTEPVEISYRSWDGHYIQAYLFKPPGFDPDQEYPTLVQAHGGGTNSYFNGLNLVEQRMAQRGYVVLAINYRGGSGFGRGFQDMAINDWANGQARDAASAADFIRQQTWSSGKVGIYGYSYGGIISLAAITRVPEAFDAAVPMGGIYDFADAYETADRLGQLFTREGHGGSPQQRADIYAVSNSVEKLEDVQTPVLIMHGEADARAPFRQYEMVVAGLEKHDKEYDSRSYPDEPHRFNDRDNRVDMYQRLEAWMDRWLKP
jgi:dipeptidyl aminopeptidase/acylaminoacyl peptidase